jgi:MFS family permease
VLTSYIMTAAITMPLSGWLATRFGLKSVFMISIVGVHPRLGTLRRTGASPSVFFALVRQMIAVVRFWSSLDSPLEGDGFEPSVPGRIPPRCGLAVARRQRLAVDHDDCIEAARAVVNPHRRPTARRSL